MRKWIVFIVVLSFSSFQLFGFDFVREEIKKLEKLTHSDLKSQALNYSYDEYFNDLLQAKELTSYLERRALREEDDVFLAQVYRKYLILYRLMNNEELAMKYGFKAIRIFEKHKVYPDIAGLYGDIGFALKHKDLKEGMRYMRLGIFFAKKSKDEFGASTIYDNYGVLQLMNNEVDSAIYFHNKSLKIRKIQKDSIGIGYNWAHLSMAYLSSSDYLNAQNYLDSSLNLRKELHDYYGQADCHLYFGDLYSKKRNYQLAIRSFSKADSIAKKYEYNLIRKYSFEQRSYCYEELNQLDSSLHYYKLFIKYKDAALNRSSEKTINSLRLQFESEKKDRVIAESQVRETDQKLVIEQGKQKLYLIVFLGGICLILLVLGFIFFRARQKAKTHQLLLSEKEKGLDAVIHSQEEERRRIAKDLHDGVAQQIAAVKLNFEHVKKGFDSTQLDLSGFDQSLDRLEQANKDIRRISHEMMPVALEEFGLINALEDLLVNALHYSDMRYDYQLLGVKKEDRFENKIEITVYRIAQELVNNILKHSGATHLIVQLRKTNKFIILHVEDNGIGMLKNNSKDGIGMYNMKSRTENVHGELNFESLGKGTAVDLRIPLNSGII